MPVEIRLLAYSAVLAWLMIITASALRARWNLDVMFGNREDVREPTAMAGRADRAAKNMLENLVLFAAVTLVAAVSPDARGERDQVELGARLFFYARLAYWPVYVLGIRYLRTGLWAVAVAGMALMLHAAL